MSPERSANAVRERLIGRFFKEHRLKAGLTQWDVARELKYSSAQFVSNWERGVSLPPLPVLPRLAALLGVSSRDVVAAITAYEEEVLAMQRGASAQSFRKR